MKQLLANSQPILLALEETIRALTVQIQAAAAPHQPRGLGLSIDQMVLRLRPEARIGVRAAGKQT